MTKKQREEFIDKPCEDNITWAAQMILQITPKQRYQIIWALRSLHMVLYKEWARDLSLKELIEAVDMISNNKEGQGALAD
jgi:hypothetical protein